MMERECRQRAWTFRSFSVGTSSCRNAVTRAWRSAQRVRRGAGSGVPLLSGRCGVGALAWMPVSVISRLLMSKANPSSKGYA